MVASDDTDSDVAAVSLEVASDSDAGVGLLRTLEVLGVADGGAELVVDVVASGRVEGEVDALIVAGGFASAGGDAEAQPTTSRLGRAYQRARDMIRSCSRGRRVRSSVGLRARAAGARGASMRDDFAARHYMLIAGLR